MFNFEWGNERMNFKAVENIFRGWMEEGRRTTTSNIPGRGVCRMDNVIFIVGFSQSTARSENEDDNNSKHRPHGFNSKHFREQQEVEEYTTRRWIFRFYLLK